VRARKAPVGDHAAQVAGLDRELSKVLAKKPKIVVFEGSQLSFISSLALGSLIAFQRNMAKHGGQVRLAALQPMVLDMLKHAKLDSVLKTYVSVEDATAA
jgi:anti-anti-sigma factor